MRGLLLMISFFTRIPINYRYEYRENDFIKGIKFLPIIGLIVGLFMYLPSLLKGYIDKPVIALLIWGVYIWITGGLHIDGFADTLDGILSNRDRERILEIMKDSRVGTFGVVGIVFLLFTNIIISFYLDYKYIILVPVIGRSGAIFAAALSNYARKGAGMGKVFIEKVGFREAFFSMVITFLFVLLIDYKLIFAFTIAYIIVLVITKYIKDKIGGMTGDTIGFTIELIQSFFVLSAYIVKGLMG